MVVDIGEHRRLDIEATIEMRRAAAAGREGSTLRLAFLDIAFDAIALTAHGEWPHLACGVEGIADLHLLEGRAQRVDKIVMTVLAHDDARQRRTDLPGEISR